MNKMNKMDIVNEVFAVWDPMELLEYGSPANEYYPEAAKVTEYIDNKNPNVDNLAKYIRQVFISYFEECFDLDICENVAYCILKNLRD